MTKMDEIGSNYDKEIIEWRDNIVEWMKSAGVHDPNTSNLIIIIMYLFF